MLHEQRLITVSHRLWEGLTQRAAEQNLSAEDWLYRQLGASADATEARRPDDADEIMLDMTLSHFRGLKLSREESAALAAALFNTLDTGDPAEVGPVGALQRRYRFSRRAAAVEVRVGAGAVSLPLTQAIRLATLLQDAEPLHMQAAA